ncbi:MAG: phosphatase PAP2 family protein [Flavobacteriales bacterium]
MWESLIQLDEQLFLWLNGIHAPWMDRVMWLFSTRWFWIPVYALLLFRLYRRHGIRQFGWIVLAIVACVIVNDQMASGVFKEWIQRPRPTYTEGIQELVHTVTSPDGQEYRGGRYGFYSSHTANLFGIAILYLMLMKPNSRWAVVVIYTWVSLVAYSRIYLGVHFPLDILMGMAMGTFFGWLVYQVYARVAFNLIPNT